MTKMSGRWSSTRSASGVVGPFAPSARMRHWILPTFSAVICRSIAAGTRMSHGVMSNCALEMSSPPGKCVTDLVRATCSCNLPRSSPRALNVPPRASLTAMIFTP